MSRRAKIVCTLGPATSTPEKMQALVDAGMDVARMNFSHGSHSDHKQVYDLVRSAAAQSGRSVGILADLQGPKIRLGTFASGSVEWHTGDIVRITVEDVAGTHDRVSTTYKGLAKDAKPGDRLLVDDGKVGLVVKGVEGPDVVCEVTEGGPVSNNKGVSLPGMDVSVPAMSEKDIEDLEFALQLGVDFVALSFVRSPADIDLVHQVMDRSGKGRLPVVAKIEKPEAVYNLEAIVLAFDAVMVARGDLGVELPLEQVPLVQKRAIQICRENAKPVIVATQMLESMINNSRPTRAEASDVANAVLDGTDAVMLSAETAAGKYPVETVAAMARVCIEAEKEDTLSQERQRRGPLEEVEEAIARATVFTANNLDIKAVASLTQSGKTVLLMPRMHTAVPLYAMSSVIETRRRVTLFKGVYPVKFKG
ncbi:MAG TPA: pyruvate kinase, partial [Amycolatopsis sp.]